MSKEIKKVKRNIYKRIQCPVCIGLGTISVDGVIFERARKACGLSRQGLADAVGLSYVTIRNIEQGITSPQRESLQVLIEEFSSRGIDMHEINIAIKLGV